METKKEIVIRRTATLVTKVPFDQEHYPNMTLEEAIKCTGDLSHDERMDLFTEAMEYEEVDFSETVTSQDVYVGDTNG
jgi:hypothetical protein